MIPIKVSDTLDLFVADFVKDTTVLGIFLVGSYATGLFSATSDIDIKIILQPSVKKRYKGVKTSNGFHISYSAYNVIEAYDYFYSQLRNYSKFQARMLSQGKILYDATGEIKHLQEEANLVMQMPFITAPMSALQLEAYNLWKYKDALLHDTLDTYTIKEYAVFLDKSLILYSKLLNIECIFQYPFFKMDTYVSDAAFRERYNIPEFPDLAFLKAYTKGVTQTSTTAIKNTATTLFNFIEEKLNIDFEQFEIASS